MAFQVQDTQLATRRRCHLRCARKSFAWDLDKEIARKKRSVRRYKTAALPLCAQSHRAVVCHALSHKVFLGAREPSGP